MAPVQKRNSSKTKVGKISSSSKKNSLVTRKNLGKKANTKNQSLQNVMRSSSGKKTLKNANSKDNSGGARSNSKAKVAKRTSAGLSKNIKTKKSLVKKANDLKRAPNSSLKSSSATKAKKTASLPKNAAAALSKQKSLSGKSSADSAVKNTLSDEEDFNLNTFIGQKFKKLEKTAFQKKNVAGGSNSPLADLVKFNTNLAHTFYNVSDEDSLETLLYALQPQEDIKDLEKNPSVAQAYEEVSVYRDLLLLGDLPTITQELRIYEWIKNVRTISAPAQLALMTSFLGLTIKLTGKRPTGLKKWFLVVS